MKGLAGGTGIHLTQSEGWSVGLEMGDGEKDGEGVDGERAEVQRGTDGK